MRWGSSNVTMRSSAIETPTGLADVLLPESHARLFRSDASNSNDVLHSMNKQIGEGCFDKMLRLALSDPDGEVWRYSIEVSGHVVAQAIPEYGAAMLQGLL